MYCVTGCAAAAAAELTEVYVTAGCLWGGLGEGLLSLEPLKPFFRVSGLGLLGFRG